MLNEINDLNEAELTLLYNKELYTLNRRLLNGVSWNELVEQRRNVTELRMALHRKRYPTPEAFNPAEIPFIDRSTDKGPSIHD